MPKRIDRKRKTSAARAGKAAARPVSLRAQLAEARAKARRCADAERRIREELDVYREETSQQTRQLIEANEAIETSHERYVSLYDYAPLAFVSLDHNGVINDLNLAAADLLGAERQRLLKLPLLNFVDPGSRRPLLDHMIRCRRKQVPAQTELRLRSRGGGTVPVLLSTWFGVPGRADAWEFRSAMLDLTDRKLAEAQEASYQKRLSSLASELSLAEERERRRIAVEIHDNLSQNLALIKMKVSMISGRAQAPEVRKGLGEVIELLDPVLEQTRSLTFELSPPVLYELGLDEALEWLAERFARQHHVVVRFESAGEGAAPGGDRDGDGGRVSGRSGRSQPPVPHEVAVLLFQAVRELLMNVVKHARARRIVVRSERVDGGVSVSVSDDGSGFDPALLAAPRGTQPARATDGHNGDGARRHGNSRHGAGKNGDGGAAGAGPREGRADPVHDLQGFGLFSIRTRLEHLGGKMEVRSARESGTVIVLSVPIPATPPPAPFPAEGLRRVGRAP